jgi:hypothetical protein
MRRLLYLALALVLLALTGLVFVRVTNTGAYVARSRAMRIQAGMSREEVRQIMADFGKALKWSEDEDSSDSWLLPDGYCLGVSYCYSVQRRLGVSEAHIWRREEPDSLDRVLEFLGYPALHEDLTRRITGQ